MMVDARSRPAVRGRDIPKSPSLMVPCKGKAQEEVAREVLSQYSHQQSLAVLGVLQGCKVKAGGQGPRYPKVP